jgi:hypothetical protein
MYPLHLLVYPLLLCIHEDSAVRSEEKKKPSKVYELVRVQRVGV